MIFKNNINLLIDPNDTSYRVAEYSSQEEQFNTQQSSIPSVSENNHSFYELLSDCYSGYSFVQSDFLAPVSTPLTLNASSLQSTTDEAYESERTATTSPYSPTISSSPTTTTTTAIITAHVHPQLIHEFEYPSPPPPVPDRRLKPPHLRPQPPPVKPRSQHQAKVVNEYSKVETNKSLPITAIQTLVSSASGDSLLSSTRSLSSRHYCGSLPTANDPIASSKRPQTAKTDEIPKKFNQTSKNENNRNRALVKPNSLALNRHRTQKPLSTCFDETANGLAIRLPETISKEEEIINKQDLNRFVL